MSRKKTFEEFIEEAKLRHPNEGYTYDESTYINTHTPTRVICPKHGEYWVTPKSHLLYECKKCSYEKRGKNYMLTIDEFIDKAIKKHGYNTFDYSKSNYTGTKEPICIICPKHGEFWQKPNDHLSGKGCPKCNESQLEKNLKKYFEENNINYIYQYKDFWLGKQSLDFFLPEYNTAIECQGKQHFGKGGWGTSYDFDKIKELDKIKYNNCKEHNIRLLYLVKKQDKSYITDDIIYKESIYFDIKDLMACITENK